jgi:hypothetical protein
LLYWYKSTNTDAAGACQARVAKSMGAVHQQQLQLAQVLARVRAEEADIVSRVSMLQIEHSKPVPANADHPPALGEHARAGPPVHEPEPVIPLAVVRRIQASREEYVRSLQVLSLLDFYFYFFILSRGVRAVVAGAQFTGFSGTKVQLLTQLFSCGRCRRGSGYWFCSSLVALI